jgi:DNA-directed RNA polymerase specialized sigma24 family protein
MANDVECLVQRAQLGDMNAYNAVVASYIADIRRRAQNVAKRNPGVDAHDVESEMVVSVHRCIEQFDSSKGEFEHLVNRSLAQASQSVVLRAVERGHTTMNSLDGVDVACENVDEASVMADIAVRAYIEKVESRQSGLGLVVAMLAQGGWTYEEIARRCSDMGDDASPDALKMWTSRAIERIRRMWVDKGDTVRIKRGVPYAGERGEVIRLADANTSYTHVVRLESGVVRAFKVEELEVVA